MGVAGIVGATANLANRCCKEKILGKRFEKSLQREPQNCFGARSQTMRQTTTPQTVRTNSNHFRSWRITREKR